MTDPSYYARSGSLLSPLADGVCQQSGQVGESSRAVIQVRFRWQNEEVEVIRTTRPRVGDPLVLAVRHRAEYSRTKTVPA